MPPSLKRRPGSANKSKNSPSKQNNVTAEWNLDMKPVEKYFDPFLDKNYRKKIIEK